MIFPHSVIIGKALIESEFSKKEEEPNMNDHANKCIECSVRSCAHHCENQDYCSLEQIHVGTHECHPAVDQCTDCKSFRKR